MVLIPIIIIGAIVIALTHTEIEINTRAEIATKCIKLKTISKARDGRNVILRLCVDVFNHFIDILIV